MGKPCNPRENMVSIVVTTLCIFLRIPNNTDGAALTSRPGIPDFTDPLTGLNPFVDLEEGNIPYNRPQVPLGPDKVPNDESQDLDTNKQSLFNGSSSSGEEDDEIAGHQILHSETTLTRQHPFDNLGEGNVSLPQVPFPPNKVLSQVSSSNLVTNSQNGPSSSEDDDREPARHHISDFTNQSTGFNAFVDIEEGNVAYKRSQISLASENGLIEGKHSDTKIESPNKRFPSRNEGEQQFNSDLTRVQQNRLKLPSLRAIARKPIQLLLRHDILSHGKKYLIADRSRDTLPRISKKTNPLDAKDMLNSIKNNSLPFNASKPITPNDHNYSKPANIQISSTKLNMIVNLTVLKTSEQRNDYTPTDTNPNSDTFKQTKLLSTLLFGKKKPVTNVPKKKISDTCLLADMLTYWFVGFVLAAAMLSACACKAPKNDAPELRNTEEDSE